MALRRITMRQLYQLAKKDRKFFNALLRDPKKALKANGLSLSPKELRALQGALKKVFAINGKRFARSFVLGTPLIPPWPRLKSKLPPWPKIPA